MSHTGSYRLAELFFLGLFVLTSFVVADPIYEKLFKLANTRYGAQGYKTVRQWQIMVESARDYTDVKKLVAVNDFFNQKILFNTDKAIWQLDDYWATPLETMGRKQGDCEDFSIAKYITLLKLGIPIEKLRLVYVKIKLNNQKIQAHMVLAYFSTPRSDPIILDNISKEIIPASKRSDLTPIFSFNSAGLWVGGQAAPATKKPETRLSRWQNVLTRMQADGL